MPNPESRSSVSALTARAASRRSLTRFGAAVMVGAAGLRHARPAAAQAEATPAGDETCPATTPEENIALVQRYWDEVWTAGGDAAAADVLAADEVHHWGTGGPTTGVDAFNERLLLFLAAFPDFHITVDDAFAADDRVVTRYTATGTHEGTWLGIPATGTVVEYTGVNIFRLACGKIAESWGEANHVSLLRQIGGLPEMAPATPTG